MRRCVRSSSKNAALTGEALHFAHLRHTAHCALCCLSRERCVEVRIHAMPTTKAMVTPESKTLTAATVEWSAMATRNAATNANAIKAPFN